MSKRAEEAALKAYPEMDMFRAPNPYKTQLRKERRKCIRQGYEQAEKVLIPLINRLCEAILFDWEDKAELARKIQKQIKEETK